MTIAQGLRIEPHDMVLFIGKDRRSFLALVTPNDHLQTHFGRIDFNDVIGVAYGEAVQTHLGHYLYAIPPSIDEIVKKLRRETQIIYPKDLGYIVMKMSIMPGIKVIEAGTGSGALTMLLAMLVGEEGHVFSYERKAAMQDLARKNVARIGVEHRVSFIERDIAQGFDQQDVHAVFLDLLQPWLYLEQARAALRGGGFFGALVTTTNQMIELVAALSKGDWFLVQAEEIMLRSWRTYPERLRPDEEMVGHTGFLVFARAVQRDRSADLVEDEPADLEE